MPVLEKADALMASDPQGALEMLSAVVNGGKGMTMDRHERAYFLLLRAEAEYMCWMPLVRDTSVADAAEYFRNHGSKGLYGRALMMEGAVWQQMADTLLVPGPDGMEVPWTEGAQELLADTLARAGDRISRGIAIARETGDTEALLIGYELLGRQYNLGKQYGRTLDCVREAESYCGGMADTEGMRNISRMISLNKAEAYASLGLADSAGKVLERIGRPEGLADSIRMYRIRYAMAVNGADWKTAAEDRDAMAALADSAAYMQGLRIVGLMLENEDLKEQAAVRQNRMSAVLAAVAVLVLAAVAVYSVLRVRLRKLRRENAALKESVGTFGPVSDVHEIPGSSESPEAGVGIDVVLRDMVSLVGDMNDICGRSEGDSAGSIRNLLNRYFPEHEIHDRICGICDLLYPGVLSRIAMEHPSLTRNDLLLIALMACGFSTGAICVIRRINVHSLNVQKTRTARKIGPRLRLSDFVSRNFPRDSFQQG